MDDIDRDIDGNERVLRRPRIFRDRADPFDTLNDEEFRKRYRFSRRGFFTLLESLEDSITTSDRSCALLPAQRLALTLQSLASNTFQLLIADMAGCSQPTVSRTIKLVCKAISDKLDYFVVWPTGQDLMENQRKFKSLTNIPGIVGCIDGTHIRIPAPSVDEHIFVNRKSFHSLNVGLACDYDLSFIWLSCRFGGSAHDSRVFRESALHVGLQNGEKKGILLGDSAYRAETYLYKPILNSQNEAEKKYTDAVCRGRVRIENAIGVLKRQFHSLHSEVRFNLSMTSMKSKLIIMTFHKLPPARLTWYIGTDQGNVWNGTRAVWRVKDQMNMYIRFVDPIIDDIIVFVEEPREGEILENSSLRNVNKKSILMSTGSFNSFLVCEKEGKRTFEQKLEVMEMISRHLLDIVDVKSFDFHYSHHDDLPTKKFIKCFVFDITRKFKEVEIFDHDNKLKAPEFDFLMNGIQVDKMELNTFGRVTGVFTHSEIEFGRHSAVSFSNILNLQSEKFESRIIRMLKPADFVQLLLAWSNGEKLRNLKELIIHHYHNLHKKNLIKKVKELFRELEGEVPFETVERVDQDNRNVLRIKRKSDANVMKLQTFYGSFKIVNETTND